ncbi:MAG: cyclic nucleotide-binding domain-containing protein [Myxococcota bacterium]
MTIEDRSTLIGLLRPRRRTLEAGDILLREGETTQRMYLLQSGQLEILRSIQGGTEAFVGTMEEGQLVGEDSLLEGKPHLATLRASQRCVLLEVGREVLDGFDPQRSTPLEYLLVEVARSLGSHLRVSRDNACAAVRQRLDLSAMRNTMASFLVHMLLGFAAYAVAMKYVSAQQLTLHNSTLLTGPMMVVMLAIAVAFARRSELPAGIFGVTLRGAGRNIQEALLWSVPVLLALLGAKWALVEFHPAYAHEPIAPLLHRPFAWGPACACLAYAVLVPVQEFLSRGAIQGPLYEFLTGSERQRWFWAIVVSNTLFGVTHLHLTLTYGAAAFVGGIVWGVLYARQRSLVGPVVSHVVIGVFALYGLGFAELLNGAH